MSQTISVNVPDDMKAELDKLTKRDGVSRSAVLRDALREYLFIHRFRALRARMVPKAEARGIRTDQDVFDQVS